MCNRGKPAKPSTASSKLDIFQSSAGSGLKRPNDDLHNAHNGVLGSQARVEIRGAEIPPVIPPHLVCSPSVLSTSAFPTFPAPHAPASPAAWPARASLGSPLWVPSASRPLTDTPRGRHGKPLWDVNNPIFAMRQLLARPSSVVSGVSGQGRRVQRCGRVRRRSSCQMQRRAEVASLFVLRRTAAIAPRGWRHRALTLTQSLEVTEDCLAVVVKEGSLIGGCLGCDMDGTGVAHVVCR